MCAYTLITLSLITLLKLALADLDPFDATCKKVGDEAPFYILKRYLFCDYDRRVRPYGPKAVNSTAVNAYIELKYANFDKFSANLEINGFMFMNWDDPFLKWDPDEHNGIRYLNVRTSEVWTPELYFLNSNKGQMVSLPDASCILFYFGRLYCVPFFQYNIACDSEYTQWPRDRHNCTLELGAWAYDDNHITFTNISGTSIDRYHCLINEGFEFTSQWNEATRRTWKLSKNVSFPTMTVSIGLQTTHNGLKSVVLSPALILTVVTLTILWLRPGSTERLILSCVNLLGHLLTIRNVHGSLPDTGNHLPNILIFYTNSLILSTIALVLTCWLQKLLERKREVPAFLEGLVSVILMSKVGQALSMNVMDPQGSALLQEHSDDTTTLVNFHPKTSKWEGVVTVISWLSLSTFGFTYFVMSIALLT